MKGEVFAKTTLPTGLEAVIYEGYGRHWFRAISLAKGHTYLVFKYLLIELLEINGKPLTEEDIENLHLRDIAFLTQVIESMMANGIPGLQGL